MICHCHGIDVLSRGRDKYGCVLNHAVFVVVDDAVEAKWKVRARHLGLFFRLWMGVCLYDPIHSGDACAGSCVFATGDFWQSTSLLISLDLYAVAFDLLR